MSLISKQQQEASDEIGRKLDETLERIEHMAHVDVEDVARRAAVQELSEQVDEIAKLTATVKKATASAKKLDEAMTFSVWTFRAFAAAMFVAAAAMVWAGYNVHELADAEARRADATEQIIWNQTHPDAMRGLWDVGQYHNDRDYEWSWRSKAAQ